MAHRHDDVLVVHVHALVTLDVEATPRLEPRNMATRPQRAALAPQRFQVALRPALTVALVMESPRVQVHLACGVAASARARRVIGAPQIVVAEGGPP